MVWYLPCGFLLSVRQPHTHTWHTHISVLLVPFLLFTAFLTAHWATATVWSLVSGEWNSLLECQRASEVKTQRERERHRGEREGIWMERGTQKFVAAGVCVGSWEMLLEEGREEVKAGQGSSWFCARTLEALCESAWMLLALGRNLEGFSCWTFRNFTWLLFKWYFVEVQTD